MICKECGAYNADELTRCRVCYAKLTEDEPAEDAAKTAAPGRRFAQGPAWPKQAYAGQPEQAPVSREPAKEEQPAAQQAPVKPVVRPVQEVRAQEVKPVKEPEQLCPFCGKPLMPGAPFCAFCGRRLDAEPAEEKTVVMPKVAKKAEPVPEKKEPAVKPVEEPDEELDEPEEKKSGFRGGFGRKNEKKKDALKEYDELGKDYADDYDDDYEDDDDDEFYEDEEGGKKNSWLFWVLIVVLLAVILGIGWLILNKNYNGSVSNFVSSVFGGKQTEAPVASDDPGAAQNPGDAGTQPVDVVADPEAVSASIEPTTLQDGSAGFMLDVTAPAGSVLHIIAKTNLNMDRISVNNDGRLQLNIPMDAFLPGEYGETETVTVVPELEIILPDGTAKPLEVPAVAVTLKPISLNLTSPAADTVEQNFEAGALKIEGTVDDHTIEVLVNDTAVPVYEGGVFSTEISLGQLTEETAITVVARKINRVTVTKQITVKPYETKDISMLITSTDAELRATNGSVTVKGTVTPGVQLTAEPDDTINVKAGTATVSETGEFIVPITTSADGHYLVKLKASGEGFRDAELTVNVEQVPANAATFKKKATNMAKIYDKLVAGTATDTNLTVTGKITEILTTSPYTVIKIRLSGGKEVAVYVRSTKNVIDKDDIGKTKEFAGVYAGMYDVSVAAAGDSAVVGEAGAAEAAAASDAAVRLPSIWAWFIWNK